MKYYLASDLVLTINGEELACQTSGSLSESMDTAESLTASQGWLEFRTNLQAYSITVSGDDNGAYLFLRGLKRSRSRVDWLLTSTDNYLDFSGRAIITDIGKGSSTDPFSTFTATLQGFGDIKDGLSTNFRILQDRGLLLLEDGDRRLLERA